MMRSSKFIQAFIGLITLFLMLSVTAVTCFAQNTQGLKNPPSVSIQKKDYAGDFAIVSSDDSKEWIDQITSVTVNQKEYSKGYVAWNQCWNEYGVYGAYGWELKGLSIGEGWGSQNEAVCIISATGYHDLILILNKSSYTGSIHSAHTGGTATCLTQAKCDICGLFYGELGRHSFTNYVSDHNASCVKDGTKTAVCDICSTEKNTITDEGSASGHSYGAWKDLNDGKQHQRECISCDHKEQEDHEWEEEKVTEENKKTYHCSVCNAVKTVKIPVTEEKDPNTKDPQNTASNNNPIQTTHQEKNEPKTNVNGTSPKTGDEIPYISWILLTVSAVGITITFLYKKKAH